MDYKIGPNTECVEADRTVWGSPTRSFADDEEPEEDDNMTQEQSQRGGWGDGGSGYRG